MKVKIKKDAKCANWFEPEEITTVLMLSVSGSGGSQMSLWSKKHQSVGLFSPSEFEIVDSAVSNLWLAQIDFNGNIILAPKEWLGADFWEKFHDDESSALKIFFEWRSMLDTEK